jgi:hypothetical protein
MRRRAAQISSRYKFFISRISQQTTRRANDRRLKSRNPARPPEAFRDGRVGNMAAIPRQQEINAVPGRHRHVQRVVVGAGGNLSTRLLCSGESWL